MSKDEQGEDESKQALKRELTEARATIQELEAELTETNEGMIALTLELEEAKERYQRIFEASNDAILLIDPEQDAIYEANPRACELFGYSHDSLVSLSATDIFPDESSQYDSFVDAVVHGWVDDFTCRTKSGKKLEIEVSASVFKLDERSLLLAAMRDVTPRKRREQRLQVLNRLFRHNLRNDGNIIQGHADILYDELVDSKLQDSATTIKKTIAEILGLSRKVRRIQDALDHDYVTSMTFSTMLEEQRQKLQQPYPDATITTTTPTREVAVEHRLSPALYEAVENGIKHSNEAEPTVSVSAEIVDEERLVIDVADQGPGIPKQELNVIHAGEESPLEHGSGVGLWFIQWVISSLGGDLTVRENTSRGSTLSMTVPTVEEDDRRDDRNRAEATGFELSNDSLSNG